MSSILSGYKYDIFISYRQEDNKGDGWVSEFIYTFLPWLRVNHLFIPEGSGYMTLLMEAG